MKFRRGTYTLLQRRYIALRLVEQSVEPQSYRSSIVKMTTKETAISLTKFNLFDIFGETDAAKRLSSIGKVWVPSGECHFVDPMGIYKTHQGISDMVAKLQEMSSGQVFRELSTSCRFCSGLLESLKGCGR